MSLLKFSGKGYDAVIEPFIETDHPTHLSVEKAFNGVNYLSIEYSEEQVVHLAKEEAIALRDYLVQICPTL